MTPKKLRELLSQEEGAKLEFKREMYKLFHDENRRKENNSQWNELIKDIISLANGNIGSAEEFGYLIIGVSDGSIDSRELYDVDSSGFDKRKLTDRLKSICDPAFEGLECEPVSYEGKDLYVITISPRPFVYKLKKTLLIFNPRDTIIRREGGHIDKATEQETRRLEAEKERISIPQASDNYKKLVSFQFILKSIDKKGLPKLLQAYSDHLRSLDEPILHNSLDRADVLQLLEATLRRSEEALENDANQLSSQLLGRLLSSTDPDVQKVLDDSKEWQEETGATWLEPMTCSLKPPLAYLIRNLKNPDHVTTLAVNTTSSRLVSGSRKGALSVWALDGNNSLPALKQKHKKEVGIVTVSPDNQKIISTSADCMIKIWDINSGDLLLDLEGHQKLINSIAITPDSRELISASDDCTLRRWSLVSGSLLEDPRRFSDSVMNSVITEDGQHVFFSVDDVIKIWNLSNNSIREFSEKQDSRISILRLFPDQKRIVSASDNVIKILDIEQEVCQGELNNYRASDLVVDLDGQSIIFVDDDEKFNADDKNLIIWNWISDETKSFEGHQDEINALALLPHGRWLITASKDKSIKIWDIFNQKCLERISCNDEEPVALAVAPNGQQFICALDNKELQVWNLLDDQIINPNQVHDDEIRFIEFIPNEERVLSVSNKTIKLWQVNDGSFLENFPSGEWISAYAVDNQQLVFASEEDIVNQESASDFEKNSKLTVHSLDLEYSKVEPIELPLKRVNSIILSDDGKYAILSDDGKYAISVSARTFNLIVWNLEEGIEHKKLEGHMRPVVAMATDLEKKILVSISQDRNIIWDLKTFEQTYSFIGEADSIKQPINKNVRIFPEDRYIISGTNDTDLKIWDLSNGELLFSLSRRNVSAIAVISGSGQLVSASDKGLEVWSVQDANESLYLFGTLSTVCDGHGELKDIFIAYSATINAVAATPCGRYAISASNDCTVKVWNIADGTLLTTFTGDSEVTACTVNDDLIIVAGERSGRIHFLKLQGI